MAMETRRIPGMAHALDLLVEIPIVAPGDLAAGTGRYRVAEARG